MENINSWLVNGPCIAGAHHPVKVRKLQSESRVSTRAVTMYGQIRRASAGTGCVTSLELIFWEGPARKHATAHKLQALKEQAAS